MNNNNKLLANMYKKAIELNSQEIFINNKSYKAIVKYKNNIAINDNFITILSDELVFIVDKSLKINDEITYKNKIYKITAVDDTIEPYFTYYTKYTNVAKKYSIEAETDNLSLEVGATHKIIVTCKEEDIIVENPVVKYNSDNVSVATISEDGIINTLKEGNCRITCTYNNVSCEIALNVSKVAIDVNYTITGIDTLKINTTSVYTVTPNIGNIEIILDSYTVEGGIAEIVESTPYSVTIKALVSDDVATIQVLQNGQVKAEMFIVTTKR